MSSSIRDSRGRFRPGFSGNMRGKPAGRELKSALLADLDRLENGRRRMELLAERLGDLALAGDPVALRIVVDRLWPVKLELEHGGAPTVRLIDMSDQRRGDLAPGDLEATDLGIDPLDLRAAPRELTPPAAPTAPSFPNPIPAAPVPGMLPTAPAAASPAAPIYLARPWEADGGQDFAD